VHVSKDRFGFAFGEDGGDAFLFLRATVEEFVLGEFFLEDVAVEEEDAAEGLVLSGCRHVFFEGEVGEVGVDFGDAHVFGMAFVVVEDVAARPFYVGVFCADGVVTRAKLGAHLVEEFLGAGCRGWGHFLFGGRLVAFWLEGVYNCGYARFNEFCGFSNKGRFFAFG